MAAAAAAAAGAASGTAAAPAAYVARCAGLCAEEDTEALLNLLKGMCARRSAYEENEYGLSVPLSSGTKRGAFRMIKQVPTTGALVPLGPAPQIIWRLVHESPPLKGAQYSQLPAAVVEVTESALAGIYSVQFMHAMGCEVTYRVSRRNSVFVCVHEGREVQVSAYTVLSRETNQPLFKGLAVEARLPAGPEQQVEAARALGSFCQRLLPMVLLKKV